MKLLFVFTGGTIGSTLKDGFISPDKKKSYTLINLYDAEYNIDFDYDVIQPYVELSENNSGTVIKKLIKCVFENAVRSYDGIIVTHGTDTIQYSACALSYALGADSIPVVLVSSNFPVENPDANGLINLHGAVKFITGEKRSGVWVSYKNRDEYLKIHRGTRLLSGNAYSDRICSVADSYFGYYDGDMRFHKNPAYTEKQDEIAPLSASALDEFSNSTARIVPYPGMKYPTFDSSVKYVIHESYHSGTINSKQSDLSGFIERTDKSGTRVFLTGAYGGESYESTKIYKDFPVIPVQNVAPIAVYIKVWMAYSSGIAPESIIDKSLCGDVF